jgi:multicomponent Na+:H+ antiporter subunit F
MIEFPTTLLDAALVFALAATIVALFLAFVRLLLGPSTADRLVALELMGTIAIGVIAVFSVAARQPSLLDAATVAALVSFLGTVGFASYLQRTARDE